MFHDSNNTLSKAREFIGYLILSMCTVYGVATFADIGITVHGVWFFWTFPLAIMLAAGYAVLASIVGVFLNIRQFGRLGEMLVGAVSGTAVLWLAANCAALSGFGMTIDNLGGAIAGGIIGTCTVTILGTLTGRLRWYGEPLWLVRKPTISEEFAARRRTPPALPAPTEKPMPDPRDNRTFEATFNEPTNLRFEHNGKVVYDNRVQGHINLKLSDFCPYEGIVVVFLDDEPFAEIEAD